VPLERLNAKWCLVNARFQRVRRASLVAFTFLLMLSGPLPLQAQDAQGGGSQNAFDQKLFNPRFIPPPSGHRKTTEELKAELFRNLDPQKANSPEQIKADQAIFLETITNCCMAPEGNGWKLAARRFIEPVSIIAWSKRPEELEAVKLMYDWISRYTEIQIISNRDSEIQQIYAFVENDVNEYPYVRGAISHTKEVEEFKKLVIQDEIKKLNKTDKNLIGNAIMTKEKLVSGQFIVIFRNREARFEYTDRSLVWRIMFSSLGYNQGPNVKFPALHGLDKVDDLPNIRPSVMNFHALNVIYKLDPKKIYTDDGLIKIYESLQWVKDARLEGISPLQPVF
jgi:hypothetical protein